MPAITTCWWYHLSYDASSKAYHFQHKMLAFDTCLIQFIKQQLRYCTYIYWLSWLVFEYLSSFWKGLEWYQDLRARRLLHEVPTIKTILPGLSHGIMMTIQQLTLILMWLMWIWTRTLILTQLCTCSLRLKVSWEPTKGSNWMLEGLILLRKRERREHSGWECPEKGDGLDSNIKEVGSKALDTLELAFSTEW